MTPTFVPWWRPEQVVTSRHLLAAVPGRAQQTYDERFTSGVWGSDVMTVSTKRDRESSVCPSGILAYAAKDDRQVLQCPSEAWDTVLEDLVNMCYIKICITSAMQLRSQGATIDQ